MTKRIESKKDDTFWAVLNAALELEFRKGHLTWTMTELSRKSKVTRSLIYYYFGRSKLEILSAAIKVIGEFYIGLDERRDEMWRSENFEESLAESRAFYEKAPYLGAFYLTNVGKQNDIGEQVRKIDRDFRSRLAKHFPNGTPSQINTLFALYFGIGFSPYVRREEIDSFGLIIRKIAKVLK